jgi:CRISPR-associated protein Csm5
MSLGGKTTYHLKLQVVTPLFVGGGDSTNLTRINYAFVPEQKKVYVLDERKWINYLQRVRLLGEYTDYLQMMAGTKKGGADIFLWLKSKESRIRAQAVSVFKQVSATVYSTAGHPDFKTNDIHGFIKNPSSLPYIPGSSIKGALRTAVLASVLQGHGAQNSSYKRELEEILQRKDPPNTKKTNINRLSQRIEGNFLDYREQASGRSEIFKGMAGLSISDSTPFPLENLILVRKKDLSLVDGVLKGEGKGTRPLYRECALPGTEVEFTLTIDSFKINKAYEIKTFVDIAAALQKQFEALFGSDGVISTWPESLKFLPAEVLGDNGRGVLILGGGAGYHSKSIISSLMGNPKKSNDLTKKIMQLHFYRHNHFQDRPLSPRALKVARVNGKDMFMGICRIREVTSC